MLNYHRVFRVKCQTITHFYGKKLKNTPVFTLKNKTIHRFYAKKFNNYTCFEQTHIALFRFYAILSVLRFLGKKKEGLPKKLCLKEQNNDITKKE